MENRKGVILQAHMDMVPQKNNDTVHDFEKDLIETYIAVSYTHLTKKGNPLFLIINVIFLTNIR